MKTNSRILIVEDEGVVAMDLKHQLEDFGYEVVGTAFTGNQAIELANKYLPDLILMDIVLKEAMDGITAANSIAETLSIPVVFLTAYSDPKTIERAKVVGAYGYLIKPFRTDELHSTIEVALYKHLLELKLKESEQWFAKTLHCINDGVLATDPDGKIQFLNPAGERITKLRASEINGVDIEQKLTLISENKLTEFDDPLKAALKNKTVSKTVGNMMLNTKDEQQIPIEAAAAPIIGDNDKLLGAVLVFRDVSERREIENRLRHSEEKFHSAFDLAAIGMALVASDGRFLQVNSSVCKILGLSEDKLLKSNLHMFTRSNHYDKQLRHHLNQLLSGEVPSFQMELECFHEEMTQIVWVLLNSSLVRDDNEAPQYFIVQFQDITNWKEAEQQLIKIANHDSLTGLLNRAHFYERFDQILSTIKRHHSKLAVMFLDLDRFKLINDTLGHRFGDLLLQAVSERLTKSVRDNDILARLGGDEFVLLLTDIQHIDCIYKIAQKIIDTLTKPFTLDGHDIIVTTSIGISIYPNNGNSSQTLMMNADSALYLAKERGKNNFQFYTQDMTTKSLERLSIEKDLRKALSNNELLLYYQPQTESLINGKIPKVEALIRWQHPELGLVCPDRFITIAEETGLIVNIGLWVIEQACFQIKAWKNIGLEDVHIAINVSPRQFLEKDLLQSINAILVKTDTTPELLEFEITESAIMREPERTLIILDELKKLGIRICIDDFGTGYSSLTFLKQFSVHGVKIDRSIIKDIPTNENSMDMVRAIIALAHELKLEVIVEGVETEEQFNFLKRHKCDIYQGYLICPPLSAEQLPSKLVQS